jgi:hypothetical protein
MLREKDGKPFIFPINRLHCRHMLSGHRPVHPISLSADCLCHTAALPLPVKADGGTKSPRDAGARAVDASVSPFPKRYPSHPRIEPQPRVRLALMGAGMAC